MSKTQTVLTCSGGLGELFLLRNLGLPSFWLKDGNSEANHHTVCMILHNFPPKFLFFVAKPPPFTPKVVQWKQFLHGHLSRDQKPRVYTGSFETQQPTRIIYNRLLMQDPVINKLWLHATGGFIATAHLGWAQSISSTPPFRQPFCDVRQLVEKKPPMGDRWKTPKLRYRMGKETDK